MLPPAMTFLSLSSFFAVAAVLPVVEPIGPSGAAGSSFLLVNEARGETSPLSLRIGNGYTSVRDVEQRRRDLLMGLIDVSGALLPEVSVDLSLLSRAIVNRSRSSGGKYALMLVAITRRSGVRGCTRFTRS